MKKILAGLLLGVALQIASLSPAAAQSSPGWTYGFVPTVGQWNGEFASKQDYLGAPSLLTTGGTMTGELVTTASTTTNSGFNVQPGTTPTSPLNGDVWITSSGVFVQVNGATVGPLTSAATPCTNCALTTNPLSQFAATTSAQLAGVITNETGTGVLVFGTGPTLTGVTVTTSFTATGLVTNADLVNPSTTVNGQTCTLGSSCIITAAASSVVIGTTTITGGTTTRVIFDNAGVLGEYSITGTGNVAMSASPTFTGTVTASTLISAAHTVTSASANALAVGLNGATNSAFQVDASTAGQAAGLKIVGNATGGNVQAVVIDSGANAGLIINAKGSGAISIGGTSTGAVSIGGGGGGLTVTNSFTATGLVTYADLVTGTQDTVLGYFGSTTASAASLVNCSNAVTYSTATHSWGCNASAGTGTVTSISQATNSGITLSTNPCVATCTVARNTPATIQSGISAVTPPAATASTTGVMAGMGSICTITPSWSTKVKLEILGTYRSNVGIATVNLSVHTGTGTAPIANAAPAGTQFTTTSANDAVAGSFIPFSVGGIVTGLTPGTAIWFDLDFFTSNASDTAQLNALTCNATEL